ncbi:MAG: hypothetical protein Q7V88_09330 [Actinomycetota bacterium]|nr:hypothetical protein [Actinomycetota bacterium]
MTRKVIALTSLAVVTAVAVAGTAMADDRFPGPGDGRGRMRDDDHRLGMLLALVALVAVVALVTWLLARRRPAAVATGPVSPASPTAAAEAILAERLARGDIDAADYAARLSALRGTPPAG